MNDRFDPYLTLGGRWDNARKPFPGGSALPASVNPVPFNAPSTTPQGQELVAWQIGTPRGRALRIWASPPCTYDITNATQVGANFLSMEFLATGTGNGGASTTRRFVVNGGQETILEIGAWESGKVELVAASVAWNNAAPLGVNDPINQGWANFAWLAAEDPLTAGQRSQLVSRVFRTNIDPITAVTIVVPPGATRWRPYGTVHAGLTGFDWPTAVTPIAGSRAYGGFISVAAFPPNPIGQWVDINGAKLITILAPVGSPYTFFEHQFELGPL
jgi:hypothetical protein